MKIRNDISVQEQQELLMGHLRPLLRKSIKSIDFTLDHFFLEKAKYEQLPKKDLNRLADYVELPERGLQVRCNVSDYALAEIWWKV